MRMAKSTMTDLLTLHVGTTHRVIAPGDLVDLDEVLAEGVTIGDAAGGHLSPVETKTPAKDAPSGRARRIDQTIAAAESPATE